MLLENKYLVINQLKIDLTFDNNVEKSIIVKTNDIVEADFKSDNKKASIKGRVSKIECEINSSLGRVKSIYYIKIDGSDEYNGKIAYIKPEDILDITIIETTDIIANPICSVNNEDQRILLLRENEVGSFQYSMDGVVWNDTGNGPNGLSAYEVAVKLGFEGTEQEWLNSLRGRDGESSYQIAVDNGFIGTEEEWLESLKGIDGINGSDGESAYQVAVDNGFIGTEAEWLASLKGNDGANGINGSDGIDGKSAYQVAVDNGFTGTEIEWLASLKGKNGIDGANGDSAYQTALDMGFIGTEEEWLESLKGSNGLKGEDGKSAYQIAVDNGFVGTEEEWLTSLKGEDGTIGIDGKSAYQIAVDNGFSGTEEEWLTSLKGEDGEKGDDGTIGVDGKSAYQIAVDNGFAGTEDEWLESLKGEPGPSGGEQGDPGKSAYQLAVDNGFIGTEAEWLESLKGEPGNPGSKGDQGQKGDTPYIDEDTGRWFIAGQDTGKVAVPNIIDIPAIPTALSQLENDEEFIKNTVNNLYNYYLKTETYTKSEVNNLLGGLSNVTLTVVQELPTENISTNTIYLIDIGNNVFSQHIYINGEWANFGDTSINLSNYVTKDALQTDLDEKAEKNHTHAELHTHTNKGVLDTITAESVQKWNNGFSGKYNDLTGAPEIPTVTNDLTNELKDAYDQAVDEMHTHENKLVLDKFTESVTGNVLYDGKEISTGGSSGANIDDEVVSVSKTWSSQKISSEIETVGDVANDISIAQKTVNTRGITNLLNEEISMVCNVATVDGTSASSYINRKITLNNSIEDYDYIRIQIGVKTSERHYSGEMMDFPVSNIVYNNSETSNLKDNSYLRLQLDFETILTGGFGGAHLFIAGWFMSPTEFFIYRTYIPLTGTMFNTMTINLIQGIKIDSVTIDPVDYVNTTHGIEDSPVGSIISYMGENPSHYLPCDGSIYNISEYTNLAQHIIEKFGRVNFFGGDGINTFALPLILDKISEDDMLDITPKMTSATTPTPYKVTQSSYLASGGLDRSGWKAFDKNNVYDPTGANVSYWTTNNVKEGWLVLDFGKKTDVTDFSIKTRTKYSTDPTTSSDSPKDFSIYGSDNGTDYELIINVTNQINWVWDTERVFSFGKKTSYRYYKLDITSNNGAAYTSITELTYLFNTTSYRYIKYEPTYYMNIQGMIEETILWDGRIGTSSTTAVNNDISLEDSIINYDEILVNTEHLVTENNFTYFKYNKIPTSEIKRLIDLNQSGLRIPFDYSFVDNVSFTAINPQNSTYVSLNILQNRSYITKVVGVKYRTFQSQGGN